MHRLPHLHFQQPDRFPFLTSTSELDSVRSSDPLSSRHIACSSSSVMMRLTTFLVALIPLVVSSIRAATTCNGDPSLCNKLYSNVTYIGAHDSYAVGSSVADNQDKDVTAQLVRTSTGLSVGLMKGRTTESGLCRCRLTMLRMGYIYATPPARYWMVVRSKATSRTLPPG